MLDLGSKKNFRDYFIQIPIYIGLTIRGVPMRKSIRMSIIMITVTITVMIITIVMAKVSESRIANS